MLDNSIKPFIDHNGKIKIWPSKKHAKYSVLCYLSNKLSTNTEYTEKDVNKIINEWHTFSDWPMLRRELCAHGFLLRNKDGSVYKLNNFIKKI